LAESLVKLTSDEDRLIDTIKRFTLIVKNTVKYDEDASAALDEDEKRERRLVRTRFTTENNYLWDRCRYFNESCELFYIRQILDIDNILTKPNQLFIEKNNKVIVVIS
jgi:hypothetical protein